MLDSVLALTLVICLITDLKNRKIYNGILVPALLAGVIINVMLNGWTGLLFSGKGFVLGLAMLILPFIAGGIGAGDVKLLATIGAIKGPQFVFYAFLGMGIAGGIMAILVIAFRRGLAKGLMDIGQGIFVLFVTRLKVVSFGGSGENNSFPYGVAIVIGVICAYIVG